MDPTDMESSDLEINCIQNRLLRKVLCVDESYVVKTPNYWRLLGHDEITEIEDAPENSPGSDAVVFLLSNEAARRAFPRLSAPGQCK